MNCDAAYQEIAYYEYCDCEVSDHVVFTSDSGHVHQCVYYVYTPKDMEPDESTPVIAYVSHGGGVAEEEIIFALDAAAGWRVRAIIVNPRSDRADAVCTALEDAKAKSGGKGNFDAISIQGTSSGARAIIRIAQESVRPDRDYSFRFANICSYDPAQEGTADFARISGRPEAMKALAEKGTVLFLQTDSDSAGRRSGSGKICNEYARMYSEAGGTAILAEINTSSHEGKFTKPLTHNSINWAIGRGMLIEDEYYQNAWYYYRDGEKIPATPEEATRMMQDSMKPQKAGRCRRIDQMCLVR